MPVASVSTARFNVVGFGDGRDVGPANTGHTAHPSWPGSFTGGTFNGGEPGSNTTISFVDYTGTVDVGGFQAAVGAGASNVVFEGCRFQFSANVSDQGDASSVLCRLFADGPVTFRYCTFQPSVANYPTRLTGTEVISDTSTWVTYGKGYQYAIAANGGWSSRCKAVTIEHCDFWGFGNAVDLLGSTVSEPHIIRDSWFHHGSDPWLVNATAAAWHNDCWLVDHGTYHGAQCLRNRMEIWGNTNCLAWQGASASDTFNDVTVVGNVFGGDNETVAMGAQAVSVRQTFTDNWFSTRIGRIPNGGKPHRGFSVSDSGTGSTWRRNRILTAAGENPANYATSSPNGANWGNPANNGLYWWPDDTDLIVRTTAHASDYTG